MTPDNFSERIMDNSVVISQKEEWTISIFAQEIGVTLAISHKEEWTISDFTQENGKHTFSLTV